MKTKQVSLLAGSAALLIGIVLLETSSNAQDAKPKDPYKKSGAAAEAAHPTETRILSFLYEDFSLSLADAAVLLREPLSDVERYDRLLKMVEQGKAHQEELIVMRGKSGERFVTESIDEWRYPTEFEPPDFLPEQYDEPKADPKKTSINWPIPRPQAAPVVTREQISAMGPTPTAFEVRNTGQTIEMEPVLAPDEKIIDLNLVPQVVRYMGDREANGAPFGQREGTAVLRSLVPQFETQKVTTSITVEPGKPHFLGTKNPPADNNLAKEDASRHVWFSFITSSVMTTGGAPVGEGSELKTETAQPKPAVPQGEGSAGLHVSLRFEDFALSLADAAPLLRGQLTDTERLDKLIKMTAEGKAREVQLTVLRTKSGQRAVVEGVDEFRYMTELQPTSTLTIVDRHADAEKAGGKAEAEAPKAENSGKAFDGQVSGIAITPTAFETRNTGETIEVEPTVVDGNKNIDLNVVPQTVRYFGEHVGSPDPKVGAPIFETQKFVTSVKVEVGKPILLGTKNPPHDNGVAKLNPAEQIRICFVTGDLVSAAGTAQGRPPTAPAALPVRP